MAVERARLAATATERSDWFERMAHTDPLTGLANERTVGRILELELARAARQESEVSIVLFDIDDFQATNREGGHQAGDDVLRRVAAVLAESVRLVDTVGRIGGDEFVLVAPGSAGLTVARRVLEGIVSLPAVAGRPSRCRPAWRASRRTEQRPRRCSRPRPRPSPRHAPTGAATRCSTRADPGPEAWVVPARYDPLFVFGASGGS